jgi:hypothetical protein
MLFELLPPRRGQSVVLGVTVVLGRLPLSLELSILFEPVERREQGSRIHLKMSPTQLRESLRDSVAVHRLAREDRQDHEVERALRNVELIHAAPLGNLYERHDVLVPLGCQEEFASERQEGVAGARRCS